MKNKTNGHKIQTILYDDYKDFKRWDHKYIFFSSHSAYFISMAFIANLVEMLIGDDCVCVLLCMFFSLFDSLILYR